MNMPNELWIARHIDGKLVLHECEKDAWEAVMSDHKAPITSDTYTVRPEYACYVPEYRVTKAEMERDALLATIRLFVKGAI
jgi:hypothetical protein